MSPSPAPNPAPPANQAALKLAMEWPHHLAAAWDREGIPASLLGEGLKGVCVAGMGGSAIGGALARAILGPHLTRPLELVQGYTLPGWVGPDWLVVAVSYSGNTAETLAVFEAAGQRGCRRLALTTGGRLGGRAEAEGVEVVEVPTGLQPRAALPYLLVVLLKLLAPLCQPEPQWNLAQLRKGLENHPGLATEAANLAGALQDRLVVVYAWEQLEPVAYRWQTQLNENAKVLAYHHVLPEADHNDIVGWAGAPEAVAVVLLRSPLEPSEVAARFELTRRLAWEEGAAAVMEVQGRGGDLLSQVLWLVQLGDVTSVALANRLGVAAEPVEVIEALKAQLAGG